MTRTTHLIALLLTTTTYMVTSAEHTNNTIPWDYPMRPGKPGWADVEDRYEALQIPKAVYNNMTTRVLADSCLDFPSKSDLYAATTLESGFDYIVSRFGALQELLNRPDAASVLLERYQAFDIDGMMKPRTSRARVSFVSFAFMSQLIKHESIVSKMTKAEAETLAAVAIASLRRIHTAHGASASDYHATALLAKLVVRKNLDMPLRPPGISSDDLAALADGKDIGKDISRAIAEAFGDKAIQGHTSDTHIITK